MVSGSLEQWPSFEAATIVAKSYCPLCWATAVWGLKVVLSHCVKGLQETLTGSYSDGFCGAEFDGAAGSRVENLGRCSF